jgi:hypothetical protein
MMTYTVRDHQTSTVNDLRALGFSADEITRLTLLKARYPLIEFVETRAVWGSRSTEAPGRSEELVGNTFQAETCLIKS